MNKRYCIWMLACFAFSSSLMAQEKLERDSFVIVKEFVPTLSQSSKIRMNPEIKDTHRLDLDLEYEFLDKKVERDFQPEPIKAAVLKGEPLVKLYRSYVILGYGNNTMPLAEVYFNQLRSKKISYVFSAKHLSSGGFDGIENSGFSNNDISLEGNYYTRKHTVNARINYTYDHVHYYGYSDVRPGLDLDLAKKNQNTLQYYNGINAAVGFGNNQRDTVGLRHYSEVNFRHFKDRYGAVENRFVIGEDISLLNGNDIYLFDWKVDYNKYSFDNGEVQLDSNIENSILYLKPGIELKGAKWRLVAKLHVAAEFVDKMQFYVYPHADFRFNLIKSILVPYAKITGDLRRNTYAQFVGENPFVGPVIPLQNTDERFTFTGGLSGNLSKNTSFDLSFTQSTFGRMPLYVKDTIGEPSAWRTFRPVYDEVTMSRITAEIIYEPAERWKLAVKGDYFNYEAKEELEAWHKPDYRISVLGGYNLGDKIIVNLMAFMIGSQKARLYEMDEFETLDGTVDVNLDLEYRYNKKISVFLDANNIASIKYEKWQDYPTMGFNVMGGFKFSF